MAFETPLLPTDAKILNIIADQPMMTGTRQITARQRRIFTTSNWIRAERRDMYGANVLVYVLTPLGHDIIRRYNERTIDRTF